MSTTKISNKTTEEPQKVKDMVENAVKEIDQKQSAKKKTVKKVKPKNEIKDNSLKADSVIIDEPDLKKDKQELAPKVIELEVDSSGNYEINTHSALSRAASKCLQMGLAPESLAKEGVPAVAAALLMCKQYALPQKAMSQMAYIHGQLTVYGTLYTALAQRHQDYDNERIKTIFIDENSEEICLKNKNIKAKVYGCVIQIQKKSYEDYNEYYFTLDDAREAGLYVDNPTDKQKYKPWQKYTKDMLYHKTKARAFGREFASALEGIQLHEDVREAVEPLRNVGSNRGEKNQEALNQLDSLVKGDQDEGKTIRDTGEISRH